MLVNELKKTIENYNNKEKDKLIVELYKKIPKKIKEEYEIDNYIINIKENLENKPQQTEVPFEKLASEINNFIFLADNDLYAVPNKSVSKVERSKWRFKVKKYYKELSKTDPITENGQIATDLLKELYETLSIGTRYLKFSSWNTFKAIQIPQFSFMETIVKRKLLEGATKENIGYCVNLLGVEIDSYCLFDEMAFAFIDCLKTTDMKYIAIEKLEEQIKNYNEKLIKLKNEKRDTYYIKEKINNFVITVTYLYFSLSEPENGIKFYHKYYIEVESEVKEYVLLEALEIYNLDNAWIDEYEKYMGKIDYRDSLREKYIELKKSRNK